MKSAMMAGRLCTRLVNGHEQMAKLLLSKGADPKIEYSDGTTAMSLAIKGKHEDIIELLRSYDRNH